MSSTSVTAQREKRWVALLSFLAAVGITTFKLVIGLMTGSLGIMAEAAHSALDMVAAGATVLSIRWSDKPADREHPYGHGKIENLSAMFQTVLLFATCGWIFRDAIWRMVTGEAHVIVNAWSFIVIGTSLVVDVSRSRALRRASRKHKSQALEADALHFETDIWSSLAVLVGLVCVLIAQWWPKVGWLRQADAVAALAVAIITVSVTWQLGLRTIQGLLDTAPAGMSDKITAAAMEVQGVQQCTKVRLRTSGPRIFVDITILMDGELPLRIVHATADNVESAIHRSIENADVVVHVEPDHSSKESAEQVNN